MITTTTSKYLLMIGIILSLLLVFELSGCIEHNEKSQRRWHILENISFTFYNGTRFFVNNFEPIYVEENENFFSLSMQITFLGYNDTIFLEPSNPNITTFISPDNPKEKNGTYTIDNLVLKPTGNISQYPFDVYTGNITFRAVNDTYGKLFLYKINKNFSTSRWNVHVSGYFNKLSFTFSRVQEKGTYKTLRLIGFITLVFNLIALLSLLFGMINNREWKFLGDLSFYIGSMIGIPFYFGVIFNYITYVIPSGANSSAYIYALVLLLMIPSLLVGAFCFALREKRRKPKDLDLWISGLTYFLLIPYILTAIYLMSSNLKDILMLYPKSPTFVSILGSNFLHTNFSHFIGNIGSYLIIIPFIFMFDAISNKKMLFINLPLLFFILPAISSILTITAFSYLGVNIPAEGFSAIVAGLLGYLAFSFLNFVKRYYKLDFKRSIFQLLWFILFINLMIIPAIYGDYLISIALVPLAIIFLFYTREDYIKIIQLILRLKHENIVAYVILVVCGLFIIGFGSLGLYPQTIKIEGSFTNILAHYVGYTFGFMVPAFVSEKIIR